MNKALLITLLIGLVAGAIINSGEAVIRAGRNMVPYQPAEGEEDFLREVYDRFESPRYSKRGKHFCKILRDTRFLR